LKKLFLNFREQLIDFKMGFLCCCYLGKKDSESGGLLVEAKFSRLPNSPQYTSDQVPETSSKQDNVSSLVSAEPSSKRSPASNGWPAERVLNASRSEENLMKDVSDSVTMRAYSKSEAVLLSTSDEKSRKQSSVITSLTHFQKDKRTMTSQWLPGSKFSSLAFPPGQRTVTGSTFSSYAPYPMTQVCKHLYLGNIDDANNELELKAKGITHILSLGPSKSSANFVKNEHFPMHDGGRTDLKEVLVKVQTFVEEGQEDGNTVLIHCHLGQNRSATVVIALLMKREDETLFRVHRKLKALRPLVQINRGYAKQLLALEKEIHGKNSLPTSWMEQGTFDLTTYEVTFKYENINSDVQRTLDEKGDL